ncbi:MAG: hypothetical protein HC888_05210 [Candidatus Competibacteraceae bacterium]|nr:hypothetical protein [Candidatus Competibacteraceae bacterium]
MSEPIFHIVAVTSEGLSIIGPFYTEQDAADYGMVHCTDPRWNVANIGYAAERGTVEEEEISEPFFAIRVEGV